MWTKNRDYREINNKNIKKHVQSNANAQVRQRAKNVRIISCKLQDTEGATAKILGSHGDNYQVIFYNLNKNREILSSCNCPYAREGKMCKHQVAVAIEIDKMLAERKLSMYAGSKRDTITEKKKSNKRFSIGFPLANENLRDYLIRASSEVIFKNHLQLNWDSEMEMVTKDFNLNMNRIDMVYIPGKYQKLSGEIEVSAEKVNNKLLLSFKGGNSNTDIYILKIKALEYVCTNFLPWLANPEIIIQTQNELLKAYGFSLKDKDYKDYFDFGIKKNQIVVIPKQKGILRLEDQEKSVTTMADTLFAEKVLSSSPFPVKVNANRSPKMIVCFAVYFNPISYGSRKFRIIPIRGNTKADGSLSNSIFTITSASYYRDLNILSESEKETVHGILSIFQSADSIRYEDDKIKYLIQNLNKWFSVLKQYPIYTLSSLFSSDGFFEFGNKLHQQQIQKMDKLEQLDPKPLSFKLTEEERFFVLESFIKLDGKRKSLKHQTVTQSGLFIQYKDCLYQITSFSDYLAISNFKNNPIFRIPKNQFENYYNKLIKPLSLQYHVNMPDLEKVEEVVPRDQLEKQLYLSENEDFVILRPMVKYGGRLVEALNPSSIQEYQNGKLTVLKRDTELETEFCEQMQKLHADFAEQTENFYYLTTAQFIENMWFLDAFKILKEQNITIFGYNSLSAKKYNANKPDLSVNLNSGIDWFDVGVDITYGDLKVSLKDVQKAIINRAKYIELKDGSLGILPEEWVDKYAHLFRSGSIKEGKLKVSKYNLSVIDSLYDDLEEDMPELERHREIKKRLKSFDKIKSVKTPMGIKAKLRDYQKEGLNWLNFLNEFNFGGCLADDMGLGKTLQIITFLKHIKNKTKPKKANLIVVPTSLIFNWQEEVKKFCPNLKILVHTGVNRPKNTDGFKGKDIVLTTYGIILRDISYLKKYVFHYIILDESQAIKNPSSQRYKAMKLLKAENRLILTGTPIENNTFDLYAQISFANPGLLGTMASFKKNYSTPIDKDKDKKVAEELRSLISPFLMRRTKQQVAKELPEKTEQVLYCSMGEDQQKLYDAYRNKYREYLQGKIEEDGLGKSKMYVLEGLTKLRQICDSPQLLNDDEAYTSESIKIKELLNHITEKTGNHKVLVFSQFVKMLALIQKELEKAEISYEYLDGKTKDRQTKVDNFQNNEDIRVFLISLKAGGTGLNLTAAEYVYLVDPWWNPAVEAQAIDRCYRIGQTKRVMAYKMICKGTIEEKIITYQDQKKQLSNDIIQTEDSFVKSLSKESITELFS